MSIVANSVRQKTDCFVCLTPSRNKVCTTCECYACLGCWGKYLQNTTNVITFIYPTHCAILTPISCNCPICKQPISNMKPLTRSDTKDGRVNSLFISTRNLIFSIDSEHDLNKKKEIATALYNMVLDNKILLSGNNGIQLALKSKLNDLNILGWSDANIHSLRLFNEQL
jgi:hypothetical protein